MVSPRPTPAHRTPLAAVADLVGAASPTTDVTVTGVSLDSRSIRPGDLYAAVPGATVHGARFVGGALDMGAAAVLTDAAGADLVAASGGDVPVVVVGDPRAVLGSVASLVYGTQDLTLPLVGITGTNGKTTTAHLLTSALEAAGRKCGLIGTVETRIGEERIKSVRTTPETTDLHALLGAMVERGLDSCVMEVSSHALRLHRVDGVRYDIAVFTNLSQDHLDFHTDMEDYFAAKAELFTPARAVRGLVCVDDEWGRRLAETASVPVQTLASRPGAEADWRLEPDADDPAAFVLTGPSVRLSLRSAIPGDFNRINTALAAVTMMWLGESPETAAEAVLADPYVPGRMETVTATSGDAPRLPVAVVDFAHTPDAVEAALRSLRPTTAGVLVTVLGAGGDRDRWKRPGMGAAAARCADIVFITDDNPRSEDPDAIRDAVLGGARAERSGAEIRDVPGRRSAIAAAVRAAVDSGAGSTVVVLGKGHETGQEIAGVTHPFDDRDELRTALDEAASDSAPGDGGRA